MAGMQAFRFLFYFLNHFFCRFTSGILSRNTASLFNFNWLLKPFLGQAKLASTSLCI